MAGEKPVNVQDAFLNHVRKNKISLTVFLINGVKLQGVVTWFDQVTMLLKRDGHSQLVYKHSISTIMPQGPIFLFENNGSGHNFSDDAILEDDHHDHGEESEEEESDDEA
jgi:host factor-I protein